MEELIKGKTSRHALLCIGAVLALCIACAVFAKMGTSPGLSAQNLMELAALSFRQCKQDSEWRFAHRHAAEGMAYLTMARKLASDSSLEALSGLVPMELDAALERKLAEDPALKQN
jgi:hypothetical protein